MENINKKGISPVVATALLLVVAVVAVVGFQSWFGTYSSGIFTDAESKSDQGISNTVSIESVVGNVAYVKSGYATNITTLTINNVECTVNTEELVAGVNKITLSNCLNDLDKGDSFDAFIVTSDSDANSVTSSRTLIVRDNY